MAITFATGDQTHLRPQIDLVCGEKSTSHVAHVSIYHVAHVRISHVAHVRVCLLVFAAQASSELRLLEAGSLRVHVAHVDRAASCAVSATQLLAESVTWRT